MEVTGHSDGTLWTKALYHGTLWNDKEPSLLNGRRKWTSIKMWSPSINMIDRFSRGTQSNKQTHIHTYIHTKQNKTNKPTNQQTNKIKQTNKQNKQINKTKQIKTNQPTRFCFISVFISSTHLWIITSLRSLCELMCSQFSNYCQFQLISPGPW